jgi:hypothetical protein
MIGWASKPQMELPSFMMNGVDERVELDAVGKISPNTSYVEDQRPFLPHPNTKRCPR